ncbi:L-serine ammonia-lyase, iron-sulfur-dependent subunit beta [Alicyclobacillus acidiphilus]|uniref:L-serine ammonia-lyase, iron-sulfur-dependent subunit beta n=1 Tax=Alicyclobacillus acidiphilus TaxID=182455 RepID=UPI0008372A14|nr:L-serine ammonia-lyase, iron-sulfur-dependent subunit beta [Alicyclobacillus acidiphilus]
MKYNSVFDIIGPIMVGPSSSHTAGAVRIGNLARQVLGEEPKQVSFRLMGSFAQTYEGHGTDVALLAGVLGMATDDPRIPEADKAALEAGLEYHFQPGHVGYFHPNTVAIDIRGNHRSTTVVASSLGGGKVEVQELDGLPIKFTGERTTLILYHTDTRGFLAKVSHLLDARGYNIARLSLERWTRGGSAVTVCEIDEPFDEALLQTLRAEVKQLMDVRVVHAE